MSKIKKDKINFMNDDYVVEIGNENDKNKSILQTFQQEFSEAENTVHQTEEEIAKINAKKILDEAESKSQQILDEAESKSQTIIDDANLKAQTIIDEAKKKALDEADVEAQKIIQETKETTEKEKEELINSTKEQIEKERVETINNAYKEGYEDGHQKLLEELDEKIKFFDDFCASEYLVEQNILKAASKEILDIILAISKKILFKEIDHEVLEKIIEKSITLLENKENINIILSEKYAKILYEFQKKSLNEEIEFNFEDFKQFKNFNITYSPDYDDDTIIVENIKERLDASITSQLDIIIRNLQEKTQKDKIDVEEFKKTDETE